MEWSDWEIGRCVCDIVNEVNKIVNEVNKIVDGMNKVVGKVNKARSMCLGRKKVLEDIKANQKDRWLRCILTIYLFRARTNYYSTRWPLTLGCPAGRSCASCLETCNHRTAVGMDQTG